MASNLYYSNGVQPRIDGLQPRSNGLKAKRRKPAVSCVDRLFFFWNGSKAQLWKPDVAAPAMQSINCSCGFGVMAGFQSQVCRVHESICNSTCFLLSSFLQFTTLDQEFLMQFLSPRPCVDEVVKRVESGPEQKLESAEHEKHSYFTLEPFNIYITQLALPSIDGLKDCSYF